MRMSAVTVTCPEWVEEVVDWDAIYASDDERMGLAILLARENVLRGTGGPFGSAVFDSGAGRLVAVGVNRVLPLNNSVLHGETVALMMAEARLGTYTLAAPPHELVTSCEPCAMCLGAALWSGVARLVCGASGEDARALEFDEGPVFESSYDYLANRGVEVVRGVRREDARRVLELYRELGGHVYNG
jgi:tRNA(Arg) A34 adenosine deaminase TadA